MFKPTFLQVFSRLVLGVFVLVLMLLPFAMTFVDSLSLTADLVNQVVEIEDDTYYFHSGSFHRKDFPLNVVKTDDGWLISSHDNTTQVEIDIPVGTLELLFTHLGPAYEELDDVCRVTTYSEYPCIKVETNTVIQKPKLVWEFWR